MNIFRTLVWLFPHSIVKLRVLRLLGVHVDLSAVVGPNLVWRCSSITIEAHAVLGFGNVLSGLRRLHMGSETSVGHWNWVSSATGFSDRNLFGCVNVGRGTALTSRHYIDATGGVSFGSMTTLAGHRSTIITHGIDVDSALQNASPVVIGDYCLIGSNAMLVPGATVSDFCLVAMGSVLTGRGTSPYSLWGGNPARKIKDLPRDGSYWTRKRPAVGIALNQRAFTGK